VNPHKNEVETRLAVYTGKHLPNTLGEKFRSVGKGFVHVDRTATIEEIKGGAITLYRHVRYSEGVDMATRIAIGCMIAEWLGRNPHLDGDPVAAACEMEIIEQDDNALFDEITTMFRVATMIPPEDVHPHIGFSYYRRAVRYHPSVVREDKASRFREMRSELLQWVAESPVKVRLKDFERALAEAHRECKMKDKHDDSKPHRTTADIKDEFFICWTLIQGVKEGRWTEQEIEGKHPGKPWSTTMTDIYTHYEACKAELELRRKIPALLEDIRPPWVAVSLEKEEQPDVPDAEIVDETLAEPIL
jgi:hypothetical protein